MPKSRMRATSPASPRSTTMLSGLRSRWTRPRRWAWSRPSAICSARARRALVAERAGGVDQPAEVGAVGVVHRQVQQPLAGLAEVDDADDVGVRQPAGGLGLAREPGDHLGVVGHVAVQDLDREPPAHADVLGPVDPAHAALAEELLDAVALGQDVADQRVDRRRRPGVVPSRGQQANRPRKTDRHFGHDVRSGIADSTLRTAPRRSGPRRGRGRRRPRWSRRRSASTSPRWRPPRRPRSPPVTSAAIARPWMLLIRSAAHGSVWQCW